MKRPARVPSQLPEPIHQRLNAYALAAGAAGVGVLALTQPVEARIVYTPAHARISISQSYRLALDNQHTDFYISCFSGGTSQDPTLALDIIGRKPGQPSAKSRSSSNGGIGIAGKNVFVSALHTGDRIKIGSSGLYDGIVEQFRSGKFYGQWANDGKGVRNRYLGLEFLIDGKIHYGWARMSVYTHRGYNMSAILTGYAYETISNKPIIAGKTHGRDDATLGRLAQGASGVSRQK
jgi:hypothetical protein